MKYLVIGLGIYGSNLVQDLTELGNQVIGVDNHASRVENIKNLIAGAFILDATDEQSLATLPLKSIDVAIVAIGENFGASIKIVALLKKAGVKIIFARAADALHRAILEGLDVQRILTPEQTAAATLSSELELGHRVDVFKVAEGVKILKFKVTPYMIGSTYKNLDMENRFQVKVIAVARETEEKNLLGQKHTVSRLLDPALLNDDVVKEGDTIICMGEVKNLRRLIRTTSPGQ